MADDLVPFRPQMKHENRIEENYNEMLRYAVIKTSAYTFSHPENRYSVVAEFSRKNFYIQRSIDTLEPYATANARNETRKK